MLLRLLKDIFAGSRQPLAASATGAPVGRHLQILLGDLRVGEHGLRDFHERCLVDSGAGANPSPALDPPLASYFLARYFLYAMGLGGEFAECGMRGGAASALFLCRAAQARIPLYAGEGLHLVEDAAAPAAAGAAARVTRDFPKANAYPGGLPDVRRQLADASWAFAHLDVDREEGVREGLEYFFPRLSMGGVIVCGDCAAAPAPGARRAWEDYCGKNGLPFVTLPTGQGVILKA